MGILQWLESVNRRDKNGAVLTSSHRVDALQSQLRTIILVRHSTRCYVLATCGPKTVHRMPTCSLFAASASKSPTEHMLGPCSVTVDMLSTLP